MTSTDKTVRDLELWEAYRGVTADAATSSSRGDGRCALPRRVSVKQAGLFLVVGVRWSSAPRRLGPVEEGLGDDGHVEHQSTSAAKKISETGLRSKTRL